MQISVEKIIAGRSRRTSRHVIGSALVNLQDFNPRVAARYVAASKDIDTRTKEYGCGTPHATDSNPKADLFHHVEHSIGRIAHHHAQNTDFFEARTRWSKEKPDQAVVVVISEGYDPTDVESAIQKGVGVANRTFNRLETCLKEKPTEILAGIGQSGIIFEG